MTEFFRFRKLSVDRLYELLLHGLQRRDLCRLFNQFGGVLRFQNILAQSDNAVPAQNKGTQLRIGRTLALGMSNTGMSYPIFSCTWSVVIGRTSCE